MKLPKPTVIDQRLLQALKHSARHWSVRTLRRLGFRTNPSPGKLNLLRRYTEPEHRRSPVPGLEQLRRIWHLDTLKSSPRMASCIPPVLFGVALLISGAAGYVLRGNSNAVGSIHEVPASFSMNQLQAPWSGLGENVATDDAPNRTVAVELEQLGRLHAEILRLRTLFAHLAEVAELNDSEFDLDIDIEDSGFFNPESVSQPALVKEKTLGQLNLFEEALYTMSGKADILNRLFVERRLVHDQAVSGKPVVGGPISSRYGYRTDPFLGKSQLHRGVDFSGEVGDPILALADGVVVFAGKNGAFGQLVELQHANGYRTRYAHNDSLTVANGQHVFKGEQIATLGTSGRSTGPHVHVEVQLDGRHVDPMLFLR